MKTMTIERAMLMYGLSDKERFECAYPEAQERRPSSTFYADFSVADVYGEKAIRETYHRVFNNWKDNVEMYAELVAALNHKIWAHYEEGDAETSELYHHLWERADVYGRGHFKGKDATYYFQVLD